MELMNLSCEGFLEELASKAAAPGGGGASALVGAAGVALGSMVGSLTVGKKKYAAVEADIIALNVRAEALRKRLEALVPADAEAFLPVAAAYKLPKETPEQQAHKAAVAPHRVHEAEGLVQDAHAQQHRVLVGVAADLGPDAVFPQHPAQKVGVGGRIGEEHGPPGQLVRRNARALCQRVVFEHGHHEGQLHHRGEPQAVLAGLVAAEHHIIEPGFQSGQQPFGLVHPDVKAGFAVCGGFALSVTCGDSLSPFCHLR